MRVLVVSAETSVAAALNMMPEWEVFHTEDIDQAIVEAASASVLLVGGGTEEGLETIERITHEARPLPAVVLGDMPAPQGTSVAVLVPPFTLEELRATVESAIATFQASPATPVEEDSDDESSEDEMEGEAEGGSDTSEDEESDDDDLLAELSRVAVEPSPNGGKAAAEAPGPPAAVSAPVPAPSREQRPEPAPEPSSPQTATPEPEPAAKPAPATKPEPTPPSPEAKPSRRQRRKRKKERKAAAPAPVAPSTPSEPAIIGRLRNAAAAAGDLEAALTELPILADLAGLAEALLGEIDERFSPEIATVYVERPAGYVAAASKGLSKTEQQMVVPPGQSVFAEIRTTREPMLIAPVDLARGLVIGIGGARTTALMVAPVLVGNRCVGVLVVGRDDFLDPDLDAIAAIAREAAPGLAVALAIDRILGAGG